MWSAARSCQRRAARTHPACIACHANAEPTSASDLTAFGLDFQDALDEGWGPELAIRDSDGDGCTNGTELGDVDGDGQLDEGMTQQSSNPGVVGDCSSASIDEMTWSELKELFNGQ